MDNDGAGDVGKGYVVAAEGALGFCQIVEGVGVGMVVRVGGDGECLAFDGPSEVIVLGLAVVVDEAGAVVVHDDEHVFGCHLLAVEGHVVHLPGADYEVFGRGVGAVVVVFFARGETKRCHCHKAKQG